ncbi:hypothetical protein DH2020_023609 [Rehmannia glutinosa]|uniref:NAC-A/B domain-containing protein n=1 Tax=Rehmannia glutinosa TaxID=99300 RepID=A0ABR0W951_REHGL
MTAQTQEELLAALLEQHKVNLFYSGHQDGDASGRSKQSRSEKKSRKAMLKLGMKAIAGVSRVTVKKSKNVGSFTFYLTLLTILFSFPYMFDYLTSNWGLLFSRRFCLSSQNPMSLRAQHQIHMLFSSEAKIEDLSSQLQTQAAEQFKAPDLSNVISKPEPSAMAQDDEEVDETGVEPKDIELVMTQAGVSRSKAVKALKAADGDIVSAIMELTN